MRDAKFRGIDVITGKWAYGYYYQSKGHAIIRNENDDECIVISETVGGFTGIIDTHGNEIFEGDILNPLKQPIHANKIVVWRNGGFHISNSKKGADKANDCHPIVIYKNGYEVIGNIYENAEFLRQKT